MTYTLYSYPNNYRAQKALIAAQYCGIDIQQPSFKLGEDNKTPEFQAKAPLGKVPVLDTPDGSIWESHAIARYVARIRSDQHLLGKSFYEQGLVDQWIDFSTTELEPARSLWLYPILGYMEFNHQAYQQAKKDTVNALSVLNNHLLSHTYLVGNQITLADIVVVSALVEMYQKVFAKKFISNYGNVTRWFKTCINQPQFSAVLGKVVFATKEMQAPKPKKEKKKSGGSKKGKKDKKTQEKQGKQGKKEKPKKPVHWSKTLPKSSMSLDATKKKFFLKQPYGATFFNDFWDTFDPEGYCFYLQKYNYNNENRVYFQAQNLLGGYLQRAESCRKFTFGAFMLAGKDEDTPPYNACGIWLFRGQDYLPEMKDHVSSEYYTWTKLDHNKDKDLIKQMFIADEVPDGKVLDRRYFK